MYFKINWVVRFICVIFGVGLISIVIRVNIKIVPGEISI